MMERGLISELDNFHQQHNKLLLSNTEPSLTHSHYTRGVFQSIGFKEFHDYLLMSGDKREDKEGQQLLQRGK